MRGVFLAIAALIAGPATAQVAGAPAPVAWGGANPAPAPLVPVAPLPALPLPVGTRVMGLGHSFLGRGTYSRYLATQIASNGLQGSTRTPQGYLYYVQALDGRLNLDTFAVATLADRPPSGSNAVTGSQQGISGDHLGAIFAAPGTLNRSRYALTRAPGIVVLDIGTNDLSSGVGGDWSTRSDAAAVIAALDRQIAILTSHGAWVVVKTVAWRFDFSADKLAQLGLVNDWIVAQGARTGVKVWDTRAIDGLATTDHSTADTAQTANVDGVHPTAYGAGRLALSLLPLLQGMVAPGDPRNLDPLSGNLFPQAGLPGTTGTKGTGITGPLATSVTATRNTGTSTIVASKEVIATGNEKQVLTITPVADGTAIHKLTLTFPDLTFTTLGVADGDWLEVYVPVELNDWAGWTWQQAQSASIGGTGTGGGPAHLLLEQYTAGGALVWETNVVTGNGMGGRTLILSAKVPVQAGALAANRLRLSSRPLSFQWRSTAGGTGVVKIGSPIVRKIADPRRAWRLP